MCLVEFFHVKVDRASFTVSGLFKSAYFANNVKRFVMVVMVDSTLPFFLRVHAYDRSSVVALSLLLWCVFSHLPYAYGHYVAWTGFTQHDYRGLSSFFD